MSGRLDNPVVRRALDEHLAMALEQLGVAMKFRDTRYDLALLAMKNAERALANFGDVYAAAWGDACPTGWRVSPEQRRAILGDLA